MDTPILPRTRPYWHVDAKWLFGLSLSFWLACTLVSWTLWRLTAPDLALPLETQIITNLVQQQKSNPASDTDITIDTAEATRLLTASYEGTLPADSPIKDFGPLANLNRSNHNIIGKIWPLTALVGLLEVIGLVRFSYRWGRLVSPAVVMLAAALPGAFGFGLVASIGGRGQVPVFGIQPTTMAQTAQALGQPYIGLTAAAIVLLVAAAIGRIVTHQRARAHTA